MFIYRDMTFSDIPQLLLKAFMTSATVMLVIGATGALAWLITAEGVAQQLADWVGSVAHVKWVFLIMLNLMFILHAAGRSLGADAILRRSGAADAGRGGVVARLVRVAT